MSGCWASWSHQTGKGASDGQLSWTRPWCFRGDLRGPDCCALGRLGGVGSGLTRAPDPQGFEEWLKHQPRPAADCVLRGLVELAAKDGRDDRDAALVLAWMLHAGADALAVRLFDMGTNIHQHVAAHLWIEIRTFPWRTQGRVAANTLAAGASAGVRCDRVAGRGYRPTRSGLPRPHQPPPITTNQELPYTNNLTSSDSRRSSEVPVFFRTWDPIGLFQERIGLHVE